MHQEMESLIQAIEGLQQKPNLIKEIMFPLASSLFSALLGAGVAIFTIRHQDNSQLQKERINTLNDWLLSVEYAMQSLISIKSTYKGKLTDNPIQRAMEIRSLIGSKKKIHKDIASLTFIIPKKKDTESHDVKWRQLPRIRAMVENYNLLIDMWSKRVEIDRPIKESIMKDNPGKAFASVTLDEIHSSVSESSFAVLIDITEKAVKYTDDLIVEMNDFIKDLPKIGKLLIDKKYVNQYGPLISFNTKSKPKLVDLIEKTIEVDYTILAELFGETVEKVKTEFDTGY